MKVDYIHISADTNYSNVSFQEQHGIKLSDMQLSADARLRIIKIVEDDVAAKVNSVLDRAAQASFESTIKQLPSHAHEIVCEAFEATDNANDIF